MNINSQYRAIYDQLNYILLNFWEYNQYVSAGWHNWIQWVVYSDTIMKITRWITDDDKVYITVIMNSNGNPVIEMSEEWNIANVYRLHWEFRKIRDHFYSIGEFNSHYEDYFGWIKNDKFYVYDTSDDENSPVCTWESYPNWYRYIFINRKKLKKSLLLEDIVKEYDKSVSKKTYKKYYEYFDWYNWCDD